MKATKQTAGNNATLKAVRRMMNDPIYRTFSAIYNQRGEDFALQYLSEFFNPEAWPGVRAKVAGAE